MSNEHILLFHEHKLRKFDSSGMPDECLSFLLMIEFAVDKFCYQKPTIKKIVEKKSVCMMIFFNQRSPTNQ